MDWLRETLLQGARFGVVGVLNVTINAVVYASLVYLGAHYILASAAGTTLGILNAFVWSKFFVFNRSGRAWPQLLRTVAVYLIQIAASWTGLVIMIELVGLGPYVAYAANIVVVTLVSFLGLKHFAFKEDAEASERIS